MGQAVTAKNGGRNPEVESKKSKVKRRLPIGWVIEGTRRQKPAKMPAQEIKGPKAEQTDCPIISTFFVPPKYSMVYQQAPESTHQKLGRANGLTGDGKLLEKIWGCVSK